MVYQIHNQKWKSFCFDQKLDSLFNFLFHFFSQIFNMVSRPILSLTMNPESYPPPSSLPPLENSSMNPTLSNSHLLPTNLSSPVVIIPASTPSAFYHNPEKLNDKKFLLWKQQVLKAISWTCYQRSMITELCGESHYSSTVSKRGRSRSGKVNKAYSVWEQQD